MEHLSRHGERAPEPLSQSTVLMFLSSGALQLPLEDRSCNAPRGTGRGQDHDETRMRRSMWQRASALQPGRCHLEGVIFNTHTHTYP